MNPDGRVAVVAMNAGDQPVASSLWIARDWAQLARPPHSIQTLVF